MASIADEDMRETQISTLRKGKDILESHATQEAAISVDPNLSEQGQTARLIELTKATLAKLMFLAERADEADTAYARAEAMVYAVPDPPKGANEVVQFLREDSIRRRLEPLSTAERMSKYLLAVQKDQIETIRAVRLAPGEPLIADEIRQRADRERFELINPKGFRRLKSLDVVRSQLHELSDHLVTWLRGYGAEIKFPQPTMKPAQYLVGYGNEVKFPMPGTRVR
jgi:hypothetical protein